MSPFARRKLMLLEAKQYLKLPQRVLNDLLRQLRRQDPELHAMLRSCLRELAQEESHAGRITSQARPPSKDARVAGFDLPR